MQRNNLFPDTLYRRVVSGHLLYAPVVTVEGGKTIFVSGLVSRDKAGNVIGKGDMAAQIRQVGENLRLSLEAAGAGLKDLVRTCTYVTNIDEFFKHVDVRAKYFGEALPTSSTIGVSRLSHPDFLVEVEAFAAIERPLEKKRFNPATLAPPVGHFDRAVKIGPWLFISGTSALTHKTGRIEDRKLSPTIEEQTRETLENIRRVCVDAGYALEDIYEIRVFITKREFFGKVDAIVKELLPGRGFVCHAYEAGMMNPGMLIEIEANAYRE